MARPIDTKVMRGQFWRRCGFSHKVMGVVEGYVVFRRKGGAPQLMYYKEFERNFVQIEDTHA